MSVDVIPRLLSLYECNVIRAAPIRGAQLRLASSSTDTGLFGRKDRAETASYAEIRDVNSLWFRPLGILGP